MVGVCSNPTKGYCSSPIFPIKLPNPLRIITWIKSFFLNQNYSQAQVADLSKKKIDLIDVSEKLTPKELEPVLDQFILRIYQAWKTQRDNSIKGSIKTFISFFKDPSSRQKLLEFISGTVGATTINLLLNRDLKDADVTLLESIMLLLIPGSSTQKPQTGYVNAIKDMWKSWWEEASDSTSYESLDTSLKKEIEEITRDTIIDPHKLAEATKYFNIVDLFDVFNNDMLKIKKYLQKILTILLSRKVDILLKDDSAVGKIKLILEKIEPQVLGGNGLEQIIKSISPLITRRFSEFLGSFFNESYSITDRAIQVLTEHLAALDQAKMKASNSHFEVTAQKLEALQAKIMQHVVLDDLENEVKKIVWGENAYEEALTHTRLNYLKTLEENSNSKQLAKELESLQKKIVTQAKLSPDEATLKKKIWSANFFISFLNQRRVEFINITPEPLVLAYFRNEPGAAPVFHEKGKQLSLELGDLFFGIFDQFFTESLLIEMVNELKTNSLVGQFIKTEKDVEKIKTLFPFLKQVILRNFIAHQMQGDNKQQGWYQQIIQLLSKKGMSRLLSESVIPVIKESYLESLMEKVLVNNPALLKRRMQEESEEDERVQKIFDACVEVHSTIAPSFKETIKTIIGKYDVFIEAATPATDEQEVESIKLFFKSFNPGESVESYSKLTNQLLFKFAGLPFWLKWILSCFEAAISYYFTSILFPYRKTPEYIAKIIQKKIQEKFGTLSQVDALFNKPSDAPAGMSLEESINDLSKLIFATATHRVSKLKWALLRFTLGSEGSFISSIFKNTINNTLLQGSEINLSLLFRLTKLVYEKSKLVKHETKTGTAPSDVDEQWWKDILGMED